MSLRCSKCGREFPSEYWFKVPGICIQCFPTLTSEELARKTESVVISNKPERPFPSVVQAFVLLPITFVCFVFLAITLKNKLGEPTPEGLHLMLHYVVSFVPVAILSLGIVISRGRTYRSIFSWAWPRSALFLQVIVIVLITWACLATIRGHLLGPVGGTLPRLDIFGVTTMVLIAPIFEETVFRGIVLDSFLKRMTAWKAILASSILFALFHLNPVVIPVSFPLGLLFGWLYFKNRSVLPTIALHAIVNAAAQARTFLASQSDSTSSFVTSPLQQVIGISVSVCALVATAFWLRHVDRRLSPTMTAPA